MCPSFIAVWIQRGLIAFTLTPSRPRSSAACLVRCTTALFEVLYGATSATGSMPAYEQISIIEPPPAARR